MNGCRYTLSFSSPRGFGEWVYYHPVACNQAHRLLRAAGYAVIRKVEVLG